MFKKIIILYKYYSAYRYQTKNTRKQCFKYAWKYTFMLLFITLQCSSIQKNINIQNHTYVYPSFYKGIYINISPKSKRFKQHVDRAALNGMNTVVLDTWSQKNMFSKEQINYCYSRGLHVVTRIIMSNGGFKKIYNPVKKLKLIEKACQVGFKEIQLDYIRFADNSNMVTSFKLKHIKRIVGQAKTICDKYHVRLSVDVFGRIPFSNKDRIGQSMENMSQADVICPMAYPSYFHKSVRNKEYTLLQKIIKQSRKKTDKKIVLWIQGFKHKSIHGKYKWFIYNQIKAVEKAGGDGFIIWNAGNNYNTVYAVINRYFKGRHVA